MQPIMSSGELCRHPSAASSQLPLRLPQCIRFSPSACSQEINLVIFPCGIFFNGLPLQSLQIMTPDSLENWSTSLAPEKAWASLNQNCEGEGALGGAAPQLNCSLVNTNWCYAIDWVSLGWPDIFFSCSCCVCDSSCDFNYRCVLRNINDSKTY